jgi:chorismate mutase
VVDANPREVEEIRQEMARLDARIVSILDERARLACQIRDLRRNQAPAIPVTDQAAIHALVDRSSNDIPREALAEILRAVFAACLSLELPVKVAFVGAEGGAGYAAARGRFGLGDSTLTPAATAADALAEVAQRRAEFAVVPFETSTEGPLRATIQALMAQDLRIVEILEEESRSLPPSPREAPDGYPARVRYAVAGTRPSGRTSGEATSFVFSVQDAPGSLLDVLRVFADRGIRLTKIHSYPSDGADWSYLFYSEASGHFTDRSLVTAFEEIKRMARFFKLLGSYPAR